MIEIAEDENDEALVIVHQSEKNFITKPDDSEDPFNAPSTEIAKYNGLSKNFTRRMNRRLQKNFGGFGDDNDATGLEGKGASSKQINIEAVIGYTYLDCILPPYNMQYLSKLYDISPAHHGAVNAKVESVFGLGYTWVESQKTEMTRNATRTDNGLTKLNSTLDKVKFNLQQWLDDTNTDVPFEETLRRVGIDYETTGNAYIEIGRDVSGQIGYIGHIPSMYMRVRKNRDGFVQIFSNHVRYFRNFGETNKNPVTDDPNPNEIIHFMKYSPEHMYYGVPDIISAKNALAGNEFASRYNLDYFENKAIPRHVITSKGASLTSRSINRLVEFFETGLRGQHHRSIYIPLGKDPDAEITFKSIEDGQQDFSFGAYREANNEEIFMAHRIPPTRAGVFSGTSQAAAALDADKVFKEAYSAPEQEIFAKKLARIFKEITDAFILQFNELSLTDANTQSQMDERDVRNQIKVPDEVRKGRGMPARPDGDGNKPFTPNAQQEADMKANAAQNRTRDANRSANQSDSKHDSQGRNSKGTGRRVN